MNNTTLHNSLIAQADGAFLKLASQVNDLLDAAQFFGDRYPVITQSDRIKSSQLGAAIKDLGVLLRSIGAEVERWKKEEDRVLSKLGVEMELLNELYVTIEATLLFFIREDIHLDRFSLGEAKQAYYELLRCNRLL